MADSDNSLLLIQAGLILALGAGVPALFVFARVRRDSLFPKTEPGRVPWQGLEIFAAFALAVLLPTFVQVSLSDLGFFAVLYGPEFPQRMTPDEAKDSALKQAANLRGLWSQTFAIPIFIAAVLFGFNAISGAKLWQMGFRFARLGPDYVLGYLGWLVLGPLSFLVFAIAVSLSTSDPQKHPMLDLGSWAGSREWLVFGIEAALLAPISEELLFRGLLLPWLSQPEVVGPGNPEPLVPPRYRSHVCYAAALVVSLQSSAIRDAFKEQRWPDMWTALSPFLFVVALMPIYLIVPNIARIQRWLPGATRQTLRGWLATSIFFAAIHSNVWPTPIPLLVLGLGLGWLALRTRSIVPSILTHMLFNGVAVVYLGIGGK